MAASFSDLPDPPWLSEGNNANSAAPAPSPSAAPERQWNLPDPPWLSEPQGPPMPGYIGSPATGYAPDSPQMRALMMPPAQPEAPKGPPQEPSFLSNLGTGAVRAVEGVGRMPRQLADAYIGLTGDKSGLAGFVQQNVPTAEEGTNNAFADLSAITGKDLKPYQPQTLPGQILQDTMAGAPLAAVGPGGWGAFLSREGANLGGTGLEETTAKLYPDSPGLQTAAGLIGSIIGGGIPGAATGTWNQLGNAGGRIFNTQAAGNRYAARDLVNTAGVPKEDLINSIDQNLPKWEFEPNALQPSPDLGTLTQNPGLQGMVYRDAAASDRANNPVYRDNALITNQAQREAVSRITPNIQPDIQQAQTDLQTATGALPVGVTSQDAGAQFRQNLQGVYDQRFANRQALGNNVFDALDSSPVQINLRPVMDYATSQAAQTAGEVGKAYNAARSQFQSGTGITLDTAPFANSVLKGLTDLADSYPQGSAAQRAVIDIKGRAEQTIMDQEPSIGQARTAYANASRPLDVFDPNRYPGPIPNAVQQTRFGGYVQPNESVVSSFLRSQGGPDAIDSLNTVFGDVKTATQPLQDYLASEVQRTALNADGTVNLNKLNQITNQYGPALNKLPFAGIKNQFSTIKGAQEAVDQLGARQNIYETFQNGLNSTMQVDKSGNPIYSPKQFDKFVNDNQGQLAQAYGQDGADRINQINQQLTDIAQGQYVKRAGQSGTPQAVAKEGNVLSRLVAFESGGEAIGDIFGWLSGKVEGVLGKGAIGKLAGLGIANQYRKFGDMAQEITRNALTDPIFAKSLLQSYNPKLPSAAGAKAFNYVQNALIGYGASQVGQSSQLSPP